MLDTKYIRENLDKVKEALAKKHSQFDLEGLLKLDDERKDIQKRIETLRAEANKAAKENDVEKGRKVKQMLKDLTPQAQEAEEAYLAEAVMVPNIPSEDTPEGESEKDNKVLRSWGKKPKLSFKAKEHWQIGKNLDIIDTERAAKVSGARFYYLKGKLAILQMALVQYGLSVLTDEKILKEIIKKAKLDVSSKPFIPIIPPVIIKSDTLYKMARLEPRDERYHIEKDDLYLVGSAEHSLGAMHMDEMLNEKDLPLRYAGYSAAFRREAGSYGKDLKGMFRVHQFDKLELESFTLPKKLT